MSFEATGVGAVELRPRDVVSFVAVRIAEERMLRSRSMVAKRTVL